MVNNHRLAQMDAEIYFVKIGVNLWPKTREYLWSKKR